MFKCEKCATTADKMSKCSQCKVATYCSVDCQKAHWKSHKVACGKATPEPQSTALICEDDQLKLAKIIRKQFVDISKIIGLVNPDRAAEFKRKNQLALEAHLKKNPEHSSKHSSACCSPTTKYYIPREEFSTVDRHIDEILRNPEFFCQNLKTILDQTDKAIKSLQAKMKERKMPQMDANQEKELLAKCLMETVNRFIFQIVREQIKL